MYKRQARCETLGGLSTLALACAYGRHANVGALLSHNPKLSQQVAATFGVVPLALLAVIGHRTALELALKNHAEHFPTGMIGPGSPTNIVTYSVRPYVPALPGACLED